MVRAALILLMALPLGCSSLMTQDGRRAQIIISANFDMQRNKKIAVLPFTNKGMPGSNESLSDELSTELMGLGFVVVERTRLQSILKEMKITADETFSKEKLNKIGEMLQLDCIVLGSAYYSSISGSMNTESSKGLYDLQKISFRMVELSTGQVMISGYCTPVFGGSMVKEIGIKLKSMINAKK